MKINATVETPVFDSFRVQQVAGMFDLALEEHLRSTFSVEVPGVAEPWSIGLIVGPSGSGKSTVARAAFGGALYEAGAWPEDKAVVDGFGEASTKEISQMLTAVGFSSPPAWIRPYGVLSNGEKFRCDLARALLGGRAQEQGRRVSPGIAIPGFEVVVFDEFTSVVDRTVAKIGSAAVARAIRSQRIQKRFVAVTCHYDIAEWLAPDWVVDMATQTLARGQLCRPPITLEIVRCTSAAWPLFARHHYLTSSLARGFRCYLASWNDTQVAFVAVAPLVGFKGRMRISRIVVLPDYQGVGIGMHVLNAVAALVKAEGKGVNIVTSHPAMIRGLAASPVWRCVNVAPTGRAPRTAFQKRLKPATGRAVVSFEFI
jgi:GNAT superfamily N-acetyltransferase